MYFFGSQLDVSRRRDAEDSLRQSQKMEAIGQLTGGIAHDFNNLLQVIIGYVDTVRFRIGRYNDAKVERGLDNIGEAAERAATLTQQLLAFARKQRLEGRTLNLNTLVENMVELANRTLGERVRVRIDARAALWNCRLDPVQAELALLNLLINARDAMPGGGTVTIATENREVDEEDCDAHGTLKPGRYAAISITDTGTGMPPEILARVLEPFFTTKEEGRGTGLGLSMVYGFVKQSGGTVRLYSEPGHGTTVRLFFPAAEQDDRPRPGAASIRAADRLGEGESVLVVEDRSDVADLARTILEDFGYAVRTAPNAIEALHLLDSGASFDLLFTDLIMPGGMNGVMLAREARKRQPKVKVLLTTGYAESSIERTDADGSGFDMIGKPYRRSDLARRVRMVLDGPTGVG